MAQIETTGTIGPRAARIEPARAVAEEAASLRVWAPRVAVLLALLVAVVLANTLPAVRLAGGEGVPLSAVADALTKAGDGWVMTLVWLSGVIAALSAVVFPRSERFIETLAITLASLVTTTLPLYVSQNLAKIDAEAASLGPGLQLMALALVVAAALPWLSLLWWNRTVPVLGRDWSKWIFLLPAVLWILLLTVFPLAYAITTSRYAFRNGRIVKDVGWGNYRKLFNDALFDPATRGSVLLGAVAVLVAAALAVLVVGIVWGALTERRAAVDSVRRAASFVPIVAVPLLLLYLSGNPAALPSIAGRPLPLQPILDKDVSFTLSITYVFVAGAVAVEMVLGFLLALLFNREIRGRSVLRTIITLPIFATPVAIGFLGRTIFYEGGGPINSFLGLFGIVAPPWLSNPEWAKVTTIITDVWEWTPLVFIIALAGLQGLPQDVLEASRVDGAGWWASLRFIVLPLMAPILWLILLLRAVDAFKVFDLVVAMTLGGPGQATRYYSYFNYLTGRKFFFYGEAAVQAFLLLFIVLVLVSLLWGRIRHVYEDDRGVGA